MLSGFVSLRESGAAPQGARGPLGILRPPGALEEDAFLAACIRCTRCAEACEPQCIRFFGPETGSLHGTPYIAPIDRACTMCLMCGEACPAGALHVLEERTDVAMGVAVLDERLCVSTNGTGVCGACHTACPLREKAITLGIRNRPEIHPEFCTGCGLCEEFCIVDERQDIRAIQIETPRAWRRPGAAS